MLAATRDPSLHPGAPPPVDSGFTRLMNVLQVAGALLAIPAGLASAWSIYHANFSVEARCQGLRSNIVSMLDKSADATTLRMLIGHDVSAFEESCGTVDPEAVAAFKTLLAKKPPAAVAQSAAKPATAHVVARTPAVAKMPAVTKTPAAAKTKEAEIAAGNAVEGKSTDAKAAQREGSDAKWLGAVRDALVSHHADVQPVEQTEPAPSAPPLTVAPPVQTVVVPPSAPALPAVASAPAPVVAAAPHKEADHPVPPALIPEAPPAREGYRLGALISHVPFVRSMFGR